MIKEKLTELIQDSMKKHQEVRTRTLRLMKAALLEAEKETGEEISEAKEIQVLQKMVKQRQDARAQYIDAGRIELGKNEYEEMLIIQEFLPKPATKEEIESWLKSWIRLQSNTELYSKRHIGEVIKMVKEHFPNADGKIIADIVKENLV